MRGSFKSLAAVSLAGVLAFATPLTAQAAPWHHGWHGGWRGPGVGLAVGLGLLGLGVALAPPAVYAPPPPVVYAPPPAYSYPAYGYYGYAAPSYAPAYRAPPPPPPYATY